MLKRVFLGVPLDADVVDGLLFEIAQKLGVEGVGHFVGCVEGAKGLRDDVDGGVVGNRVLVMTRED